MKTTQSKLRTPKEREERRLVLRTFFEIKGSNKHKPRFLGKNSLKVTRIYLKEIFNCNQGLNQWEIDFINDVIKQNHFSPKQTNLIKKLRQKVFEIGFLT